MTNPFLKQLQKGETLVADGATGTNLQKAGLTAGMPPEAWVIEAPNKIMELERSFVDAGSNIILTCTFGGTSLRLKDTPYAERAGEINRKAVELARKASASRSSVLVGGSMGPVGGLLKPYGSLTFEEVSAAYFEQAEALTESGVDLLVIETQFSLDEAKAAIGAAHKAGDLPIVVSFSFDRGTRTMMGVKPEQVVNIFRPMDVAVIGANCGTTLENMETIIHEYGKTAPGIPLWAKPNAGLPMMDNNNNAVYTITPEQMGEFARKFVSSGAHIVGGCCGSTPEHIAGIVKAVRKA